MLGWKWVAPYSEVRLCFFRLEAPTPDVVPYQEFPAMVHNHIYIYIIPILTCSVLRCLPNTVDAPPSRLGSIRAPLHVWRISKEGCVCVGAWGVGIASEREDHLSIPLGT